MKTEIETWITSHGIAEVECLVPDMNGVVRGKVFPAQKFLQSTRDGSLRLPSSIFSLTLTGEYATVKTGDSAFRDQDMVLRPDASTLCVAPGYSTPTAFVFADTCSTAGEPWEGSPRQLLKQILGLYRERGWRPVVAPELEFYLTSVNTDPDLPLTPPLGRSGRSETSPQPYGLEAITEYEELIEMIYEYAETASLHLDTMIHESGTAQLEINFNHGDPVALSDQVVVFKRIVRQVALKHGVYATFMAKPMESQPGSAMHLHISVNAADGGAPPSPPHTPPPPPPGGPNLFAGPGGADAPMFRHFVGGLQRYLPEVAPLFGPNVNSFRRMRPHHDAPINVQWGYDNRSCGLRVPIADDRNRRVENRLPGADANPYLAIGAALVCGYLGVAEAIEPSALLETNAYAMARTLPRTLEEALDRFAACAPVRAILGEAFCQTFTRIKEAELEAFQGVISSWERDHLLLKV